MATKNTDDPTFVLYSATIRVEVSRKTSRYDSDVLAKVETTEEFPMEFQVTLDNLTYAIHERIAEAERKIERVLDLRGEFERKVKLALNPGSDDTTTIEGTVH